MLNVTVKKIGDLKKVSSNIRFGTAVGLTKMAKDAQNVATFSIMTKFTVRGQWLKPSNKFGIKVKSAKKSDLVAEVKTAADWLVLHETGGIKTPRSGRNLAIPTENVRRNKRQIITKGNRPNALRGKRTFVIQTKKGKVLFQRKGKGKRGKIVALYNLEPKARIKKRSAFFEPIDRAVRARLSNYIEREIKNALATMK